MVKQEVKIVFGAMAAGLVFASVASASTSQQPPTVDNNVFGLATRAGVCPKPPLAKQLQVNSTDPLRLVPPFASFGGYVNNGGLAYAKFKGVTYAVLDVTSKLVEIDDIGQLTPCAPDDRTQCATSDGTAFFADGTFTGVKPGEQFDVHIPWRFRNHTET
jgi:hypothetical protein